MPVNALYRNARVIAVSGTPYRAKLASELGAEHVINPDKEAKDKILDLTGGRGVTAAIDCSGEAGMQNLIIKSTARNGRVAFVGESGNIDIHVSDTLIRNGLTLYGIWHYNYTGINKLFDLVRFEKGKINKLITHCFTMDEVDQAWRLQLSRKCAKVLLVQES
jgi:propanol-preferring alcohol dehydrogenase